ncbi:ribonuclease H-like domain-containing protein [Tanacetum coccineum]
MKCLEESSCQIYYALVATGLIVDSVANQHLTYTDKYLVNVIDIFKLRIKVSHPNGTKALITKVGNMKLTKHLTLYDVLVLLEYCVSLMYVHKVARDNKFVVSFDESHCYILPQDLREMKVLGIGKQKDSLYYFDGFQGNDLGFEKTRFTCNLTKEIWHCRLSRPSDQVMTVIKSDIVFEKTKEDKFCEICQKAKQTREPFPLSDHSTTTLGELVHLHVWRPYKVVSKEGFKYLLTIVDDFFRAVWVYLLKTKDEDEGSSHSRLNSPTFDHFKDSLGHLHGSNSLLLWGEMAATYC